MPTTARSRVLVLVLAVACAFGASTCGSGSPIETDPTRLTEGTWGGDDAGLVVGATQAHVHFGCTYGDFSAPIALDSDGRFSVSGGYLIRAYPVAVGPTMPAELAGVVRGRDLTMTVAVNDTIENELVVFGPTTVRLGRDPQMQMCPICEPAEVP